MHLREKREIGCNMKWLSHKILVSFDCINLAKELKAYSPYPTLASLL